MKEAYYRVFVWHEGVMSSIMFENCTEMLDFIKEEKQNTKCNAIQAYVRMESLRFIRELDNANKEPKL